MFKPILFVAMLGGAMMASPAVTEPVRSAAASTSQAAAKKAQPPRPARKPASGKSGMIPAVVLLTGVVLVTLANRRRNLHKVHY